MIQIYGVQMARYFAPIKLHGSIHYMYGHCAAVQFDFLQILGLHCTPSPTLYCIIWYIFRKETLRKQYAKLLLDPAVPTTRAAM